MKEGGNMTHHFNQVFEVQIPRGWFQRFVERREEPSRTGSNQTHPTGRVPPSFHHITVTGTTEFHDYETFGSDEHGTFGFRQETTLSTNDLSKTLLTWQQGFGGEERVEIDIDGSLQSDGAIAVTINARFFEGATEGTHELEDSRAFQAIVPQDQTSNFDIHLKNDEDDWATIRASIGNQRV
ncbi:MAG: hypothetical protein ACPK85_01510 [Methanosarcina sp.]